MPNQFTLLLIDAQTRTWGEDYTLEPGEAIGQAVGEAIDEVLAEGEFTVIGVGIGEQSLVRFGVTPVPTLLPEDDDA